MKNYIYVNNLYLLNAIIGDVCGSIYEYWKYRIKYKPENLISDKCRFTDDTVLTCAVAEAIMSNDKNFQDYIRKWSLRYPNAGYGGMFVKWMYSPDPHPYFSYGNGSAMRVSPCAYYGTLPESIVLASTSAAVTHNHPEGMLGASTVNICIHGMRSAMKDKCSITELKDILSNILKSNYPNYDLEKSLDYRRPMYKFDSTCQGSVPQSIQCVLEAEDYEDAIKLAISMGGDSDTMACIAGSIAGIIWEKPKYLCDWVMKLLPDDIKNIIYLFDEWVNQNLN